MNKGLFRIKCKSFSLIEIVFSISLFSVFITIIIGSLVYAQDSMEDFGKHSRGISLAEEGQEAVKAIKNNDFANLTDGSHGLTSSSGTWQFTPGEETIDNFKRSITVSTVDEFTKKIDVRVTWNRRTGQTNSFALSGFLTNWGVISETIIPGFGDWTGPFVESYASLTGGKDGMKVQVAGNYCYIVRDSAAQSLATIDITDTKNPVVKSEFNLQDNPKNIYVQNNLAYIATKSNTAELQIIDVTDPASPIAKGSFDAGGIADAYGITVRDNHAYLAKLKGSGPEFFIIDVGNPDSPTEVGSLELDRNANDVVVMDDYAYIASGESGKLLTVVDISDPANPQIVSTSPNSPTLSQNAMSIAGFEKTIFIGTELGVLYVIDVSNPASPELKSTSSLKDGTSNSINDISLGLDNHYLFMASDIGSREFQVFNVSAVYPPPFWQGAFKAPSFISSVDTPVALKGVAFSNEKDRAFAVGLSNDKSLMIMAPKQVQP